MSTDFANSDSEFVILRFSSYEYIDYNKNNFV